MGTQITDRLVARVEPLTEEVLRDDTQLAAAVRRAVGQLHLDSHREHGSGDIHDIAILITAFVAVEESA